MLSANQTHVKGATELIVAVEVRIETNLEVIFPRHISIGMTFTSAIWSSSKLFGRRAMIPLIEGRRALSIFHLHKAGLSERGGDLLYRRHEDHLLVLDALYDFSLHFLTILQTSPEV